MPSDPIDAAPEAQAAEAKAPEAAAEKRRLAPFAAYQLATEAFFFLPLFFLLTLGLSDRFGFLQGLGPAQALSEALACAALGWLFAGRPGIWRTLAQLAAGLIAAATLAWLLLAGAAAIPLAAAGFLCALRGRRLAYSAREAYFQPTVAAVGLLGYFLLPLFLRLQPSLEPYRGFLSGAGAAALGLFFFRVSRMNLQSAGRQKDGRPAPGVLWKNRLWALLLFGLVLLAGFMVPIGRFLGAGFRAAAAGLLRLYRWLLPAERQEPAPIAPGDPQAMPALPEATEPRRWLLVAEKIVEYAVWIALAVALLFLLYQGAKRLPRLLGRLKALLARLFGGGEREEAAAYRDERESLLELSDTPRLLAGRMKEWLGRRFRRKESWEALAGNRERVRYLYRQLLKRAEERGKRPSPSATPLEVGRELAAGVGLGIPSERLTEAYSSVRYGEGEPTDKQVEELAESVLRR
ncbi:DUF4129 domain-containing protein [Gorillibacterium sp. sgz500922]|uniref:DUF4129 domain-containing protein n=1 Tax=Gorillibacterium sp. sgz500922 TaxID=3446694 RepID=UPI003F67B695